MDVAIIFGLALATRSPGIDLVMFGTDSKPYKLRKGASVLGQVHAFRAQSGKVGHGTETAAAVRRHFDGHDRVVILTDEAASWDAVGVSDSVPASVPLHTFNLQGYTAHHAPAGSASRFLYGGLTDRTFAMMQTLEAGDRGDWPF
jgi:hypothetical protein